MLLDITMGIGNGLCDIWLGSPEVPSYEDFVSGIEAKKKS